MHTLSTEALCVGSRTGIDTPILKGDLPLANRSESHYHTSDWFRVGALLLTKYLLQKGNLWVILRLAFFFIIIIKILSTKSRSVLCVLFFRGWALIL